MLLDTVFAIWLGISLSFAAEIIPDEDNLKHHLPARRLFQGSLDDALHMKHLDPLNYDMFRNNEVETICRINSTKLSDISDDHAHIYTSLEEEKREAIEIIRKIHEKGSRESSFKKDNVAGDFGYWSYVVSYSSKTVLQLHKSGGNLLFYRLATISSDAFNISSDFSLMKEADGTRYLTQNCYDGNICDLTGKPRSATIKYMCNPEYADPIINDIVEPQTCNYLLTVSLPELCESDIFIPKSSKYINNIMCEVIPPQETEIESIDYLIDVESLILTPMGHGIFMGSLVDNPHELADVLVSNRYTKETLDSQRIVEDIMNAWIDSIRVEKIKGPRTNKGTSALTIYDSIKYVSHVYGLDGKRLCTVLIRNLEDSKLAVVATDHIVIENYLEVNGTIRDINYLKAEDMLIDNYRMWTLNEEQ